MLKTIPHSLPRAVNNIKFAVPTYFHVNKRRSVSSYKVVTINSELQIRRFSMPRLPKSAKKQKKSRNSFHRFQL